MTTKPSPKALAAIGQYLPHDLIDLFCQGLEEFNQGEFYACHETLEAVWQKQTGAEREATQGIIQIAVALYHLERKNEIGAIKLFERGVARVERYEDRQIGLQVSEFSRQVRELLTRIKDNNLPPENGHRLQIMFL